MNENIAIWHDADVQAIYDLHDGQPIPRFAEFNGFPEQAELIFGFVRLDMQNGSGTPATDYIDACLAGVRAVEGLAGKIHPGWIKFLLCQIDRNNSLLWDQYRQPGGFVAAMGEWLVTTIERFGWGPDGNSTPLGQRHSNAMAVAAEAGGGIRQNRSTGLMEYGDGSEARQLAGVTAATASSEPEESSAEETLAPDEGLGAWQALGRIVEAAEDGDDASKLVMQGAAASVVGDHRLALELYERAARLGEPQGMYEAGVIHRDSGDRQSAVFWLEAAADAGLPDAYGHLANLAEEAGDPHGEREWSRRGAEAGHAWSMANYAYFLLMDARQQAQAGAAESEIMPVLRQCLDYATRAANQGQVSAMFSAGLASVFMERRRDALEWLSRADQNGHPDARRMIQQFNLG